MKELGPWKDILISKYEFGETWTRINQAHTTQVGGGTLRVCVIDENQKDVVNRKNGQGSNHLKLFLLVFSKDEAQAQSPSLRRPKPKKPKSIPWGASPSIK